MLDVEKKVKRHYKNTARENHKIRISPSYKLFRNTVLARDDYTCQICGSTGDVEAHHLYSFETTPAFRLNPNYAVCLCKKCHEQYHEIISDNHNINPRSLRKFRREKQFDRIQ